MSNNITIQRNNKTLTLIKDHRIFEVFYRGEYLGYFPEYRLDKAINDIENNGFHDGYNYDIKMNKVDTRLNK